LTTIAYRLVFNLDYQGEKNCPDDERFEYYKKTNLTFLPPFDTPDFLSLENEHGVLREVFNVFGYEHIVENVGINESFLSYFIAILGTVLWVNFHLNVPE
jgi:hypothetical protein